MLSILLTDSTASVWVVAFDDQAKVCLFVSNCFDFQFYCFFFFWLKVFNYFGLLFFFFFHHVECVGKYNS